MKKKIFFNSLIIFFFFLLFSSALNADWGAPPVNGKGLKIGSRIYPSLFFAPSSLDFSYNTLNYPVKGRWKLLVILVQFSDYPHNKTESTPQYFHDMIMGGKNYPFKDMNSFYLEMSGGRFGFSEAIVTNWYTLPHTREYYACNADQCDDYNAHGFLRIGDTWYPEGVLDLANDALNLALKNNPDLSLTEFDNNNDGVPESIFIIHSGTGAESSSDPLDIWSHRNEYSVDITYGQGYSGSLIYVMGPELFSKSDTMPVRMGVFAHEFGHVLNLPDLYDTDYSSCGDGPYSLMSYGVHTGNPPGSNPYPLDAWSKTELGWAYPIDITINTCGRIVYPIQISNVVYRYNPRKGEEYFLVAFRKDYGFDHQMFSNLAKDWKGAVYIWHVDESKGEVFPDRLDTSLPYNTEECVPTQEDCSQKHYVLSLVQADGLFQLEQTPAGGGCATPDWGDLYHSGDYFSINTVPNSNWWDNTPSNFTVDIIKITDDYAKINFIVDPDFKLSPPEILSIPKTSVEAGKLYKYQVRASGYGLSFELEEGPKRMSIDPATGIIKWQTSKNNIGNHRITVKVENCGGDDEQQFILVVYEPPSQGCSCRNSGTPWNLLQIPLYLLLYLILKIRFREKAGA